MSESDAAAGDHGDELALCVACAASDPVALAAFDARYGGEIVATLRRMRLLDGKLDDVKQRVYEKLFVASGDQSAKIAAYRGRGALGSWLRVIVVRTALNAIRERRDVPLDDGMLAMVTAPDDPELELMKLTYRAEFQQAFRESLASLEARDQNLLRHVFLDGLDPGKVGRLYRVHRTTAMRWIAAAREALLARTRTRLVERLKIDDAELDSIIRLIDSQLELGLSALEP